MTQPDSADIEGGGAGATKATGWLAKAKQATAALKAEYQAGKQGEYEDSFHCILVFWRKSSAAQIAWDDGNILPTAPPRHDSTAGFRSAAMDHAQRRATG